MKPTADEERDEAAADDAAGRARAERARVRAYLDLWEAQLVQTALHGPEAPWRPTRS